MANPRGFSIKGKLIALLMLTSGVALLLGCSAFVTYELLAYRGSTARELKTIAEMIAETSTAALAFSDARAARDTLSALRAEPSITEACIYDRDGAVFATYRRSGQQPVRPPVQTDGMYFSRDYLMLFSRISFDRERVGTIYLKADLSPMYARLWRYLGIAGAVMLASWLVTLLISSVVQRVISEPILQLAETAADVSSDRDYSLRVAKTTEDELGTLVDRFNEMMAQIQSRDRDLQAAHDNLEARVASRTEELEIEIAERRRAEEDLIAAKLVAEASNRAKSVFLANMSHELRTPLNAIIGYSELLEEELLGGGGEITETGVADLRKIHGAGKHLLALINDVLDLSKIEAGKMDVRLQPVLISEIVDEVVGTVEPMARKNGNVVVVRRLDGGGSMRADVIRFRQCLLNLLSNACKFTEKGTVTLEVARLARDGHPWVVWRISDTGIGIAPDQLQKLFQSFSQVDSSATRKYGGTGLGLAISQKFCQLMGGRITVTSALGKGSTFTVWIPAEAEVSSPELVEERSLALTRLQTSLKAWREEHPVAAMVHGGPQPREEGAGLA